MESATRPGVLYHVSATSCARPAGQKGIPCKHRACFLAQIGELPLEAETQVEPEPQQVRCGRCFGEGECWLGSHDHGWVRGACPWCGGSGTIQVPITPELATFPEVVPAIAAA